MKKRKLKMGATYIIKHTGEFCSCVGNQGLKDFSTGMNTGDTTAVVYVGTFSLPADGILGHTERCVFYNPENAIRRYYMFATQDFSFIVKELE